MSLSSYPKPTFRYDINALRCLAIVGVLLFHFKVPAITGGFSGVDVFFVISGYLMTRIIVNELKGNRFSLLRFYHKRAIRIIPALLGLIASLVVICFFIYFPDDYKSFLSYAISAILFVSNFLLYSKMDYFAPASDTNILLHTWSLSVEWQFYLIYPIALIFFNKYFRHKIRALAILAACTALVYVCCVGLNHFRPSASFYLFPARAWEMLAGGVAYYLEAKLRTFGKRKLLAGIGYLIILLCYFFFHDKLAWPGPFTIVPVAATVLVIAANVNDFSVLRAGPVQWLGKISYSLYLWHWPVYVIAQYRGVPISFATILVMIALSLVLGFISYLLIESRNIKRGFIVYTALGALAVVTLILPKYEFNARMFKPESLKLSSYSQHYFGTPDASEQFNKCFVKTSYTIKDFDQEECLSILPGRKNVLLIGDSHAAHFSSALKKAFAGLNIHLCEVAASGCSPVIRPNGAPRCSEIMSFVYRDYIKEHAKELSAVIITADWSKKGEPKEIVADVNSTIAYLKKYHLKAIVLGQTKNYIIPYPTIAA
ncbi:acyltransferase family protein [Mucilaginibacter sp. PAMB04274]|uniref:acyltransferase family protein n=1 Tax=Mucilaginibacter sp. PAMB04274 TaxID=3138568 RepID=UPI0031F66E05